MPICGVTLILALLDEEGYLLRKRRHTLRVLINAKLNQGII